MKTKRVSVRRLLSTLALTANVGLFCSTAIQVGFAYNLNVPTVPKLITMGSDEALALPGPAARDWAAGACVLFAALGLLAIFDKVDRRPIHCLIGSLEFLTLLPIALAFLSGHLPGGADWIFMHHCIAGALIFLTMPPKA